MKHNNTRTTMQQGCCDMFGLSGVEKPMAMRMGAADDIMELHHSSSNEPHSSSPPPLEMQACSGDEDSGEHNHLRTPRSPATSCENSAMEEEPTKAAAGGKKRRKQSNPLRYQNAMPLLEGEDCHPEALDLQSARRGQPSSMEEEGESQLLRCHHCSDAFESEDQLRVHVEEEHVQKVLERQLQQQSYNNNNHSSNRTITTTTSGDRSPKSGSEVALQQHQQLVPFVDHPRTSTPNGGMLQDPREYKSPHFPFPPMPPFIPFSRDDSSKPGGGMPVPPSMFPNPMMPFLFPVIPQGQTPPATNGSSHSGGQGVRIFNLEAYCELCNKEFCNKYFLKTHKANKHGIYSVDSISSSPYGGPFLSPSLTSPIPMPNPITMLPTSVAESPLPQRTGLINMESYCEICQKEFCNKYFLKKHRQKIHGIVEPGQTTSPCTTPMDTKSSSPVMTTAALALTSSAPSFLDKGGSTNHSEENHHKESSAAISSKLEFSSIFGSMQGQSKPSTVPPSVSSAGAAPSATPSSSCPPTSLLSPGQQQPQTKEGGESFVPHVFTPEKLREMGVINADAFCELCCKEFCNKYFLRTHKLNKHGINMPEISPGRGGGSSGPQSSSSSQNQNSQSNDRAEMLMSQGMVDEGRIPEGFLQDSSFGLSFEGGMTGELSCDYCNRPFSSLYLLKMHKFYTHNVPFVKEESKSKPNSPTGEGNNNSSAQENKENEFLKPHLPLSLPPNSMFGENSPTPLQEDAASQDLQKLQSMIRELNASAGSESSKIVCNLCKLEFDNKYFLRAHMMNEHGVLPNEDGHVTGLSSEFNGLTSKASSENGPDVQRLGINNNASPSVDSEAYCEICQKEFCSKYFLKTHKQNIHGMPVDMSSTPKKSLAEEVSQIKTIVNNTSSTSLVPLLSNSSSAPSSGVLTSCFTSSSQPMAPLLTPFSSHLPLMTSVYSSAMSQSFVSSPAISSTLPSTSVPSLHGSATLTSPSSRVMNSISSSLNHSPSLLPSNLTMPKMSPSMASLNHSMSIASLATSSNNSSSLSSIAQIAAHTAHLPSLPHPGGNNSNPLSPLDKPPRGNLTGRNYCNICNKELCNKYFMKTHMLKMHGINLDSQPHEAARISTIGGVQCDICQKELCSKYFLKVHKQNTHGIFEEGAQQGKGDHPPFLDKEQPLQGLDLSDPSGRYFSHYPEICPVCNCRFKSIKWLKAHMISDHGNILKENFPLNALPSPPRNNNNNNGLDDHCCLCVLCGQGFADKVALHVHLIKDHQSGPEDSSGNILKAASAESSAPQSMALVPVNGRASPAGITTPRPPHHHPKPHGGSRIYHCSFCVYSTRWLSNLYAHEKRHTGVITEGEKKFVCRVCHRAYRYNHSLQRHFLSHRAAGLAAKDLAQPLVVTSQSAFTWSGGHLHHLHHRRPGDKGCGGKIKRYRCSKCSKKFRSRELCLAHIHSTHKRGSMLQKSVKPFRCRFCGFQTRVWNVLRIHINRQHHNEILESSRQHQPQVDAADDKSSELSNPPTVTSPPEVPSPKADGFPPDPPPNSPHLPMTFAMPQNPPQAGSFIMQPFLLAQPDCDGVARNGTFVPSLVYLPVCQKVAQPMTVAFTLTPA